MLRSRRTGRSASVCESFRVFHSFQRDGYGKSVIDRIDPMRKHRSA
jgi:hypothetical protein